MRIATTLAVVTLLAGCVTPSSSAWTPGPAAPPSAAPVRVAFVREPAAAEELGAVEANGRRPGVTLEALVAELRARAASIGGDQVRVDRFATRHEMVREQYAYDCSTTTTTHETRTVTRSGIGGRMETHTETVPVTKRDPKTCQGWHDVEAATLTLTGRAFRTKGAQP